MNFASLESRLQRAVTHLTKEKGNGTRVIPFKTAFICILLFFSVFPSHMFTLLSLLLQSLTLPLLPLHPAPAPSHVVVCGHSSNRLLYPLRRPHVTAHALTHRRWNYSAIQPYLTSHMTAFLIPRPGSTPANYKLRVFIWSQARMLAKRPVVRGPSFIPTSFTPDSAGLTAPISNCSSSAICCNFEF